VENGKPRVGDRVRLTIIGYVNYVEDSGFTVRDRPDDSPASGGGIFFHYDTPALKNVDILERKRQIGDKIDRNEIMPWEPAVGTLIRHTASGRHYMKMLSSGRWIDTTGNQLFHAAMPGGYYRIMMLGGEQVTIS